MKEGRDDGHCHISDMHKREIVVATTGNTQASTAQTGDLIILHGVWSHESTSAQNAPLQALDRGGAYHLFHRSDRSNNGLACGRAIQRSAFVDPLVSTVWIGHD